MTIKYKNGNNIYAWRNSEGYWLFSKESDVNTNNYILKSTTNNSIPYSHDVKYVTKQNIEVTVNISINNSSVPEVATKEILVAAGFDELGYPSVPTNGEYELVDSSATGTARQWYCSANNMNIVWSSGGCWIITQKGSDMSEYYSDASSDPWDVTWNWNGIPISGATVTKKANAGGESGGGSSEEPEVPFGTRLLISGTVAENEGLDGIYELNESASTDTNKEWINTDDSNKKVMGYWEVIDNLTYWTVRGGSDNYSATKPESSLSYPWNADNGSLVWYYHGENVSDFHVTPYVSDEEEPSTPDTPSEPVEPDPSLPDQTLVSFTIKDAIEWDDVNGVYTQTEDTYGKTGKEAIYTMTSSNGTFKCHYVSDMHEWHIDKEGVASRYYSPNDTDNPWDSTNWYEYSTSLEDRSIKVELNQGDNNGGSNDEPSEPSEPEVPFGTLLYISGTAAENEGLDGIYELNKSTATDIYKEWIKQGDSTKKVSGSFVDIDPATYWGVYGGSDNYYYDNWGESNMSYPWNADNSSFVWYYHGEAADFYVTPYVSGVEDPSAPDTPSEPVEPSTPSSTQNSLIVTNGGNMNGTYNLTDSSATGTNRVWENSENGMRIIGYDAWGVTEWVIQQWNSSDEDWYSSVYASGNNPYNDDGTSLRWGYGDSISEISVVLATAVGGSSNGSENVANTITVSNTIYPSVIGDYVKTDSSATGKNAIYINDQEGYIIKYVDIRWEIRHVMESLIYYATQDADNPWEVPQNSWWFEMGLETDHGITITVAN